MMRAIITLTFSLIAFIPTAVNLRYFSHGVRDYGKRPVPPITRTFWEFQAVLRGKITPWLPHTPPASPEGPCLWIFPPALVHGWQGDGNRLAEITVFHFAEVPAPLAQACPEKGWMNLPLSPADVRRIQFLTKRIQTARTHSSASDSLYIQHVMLELALFAMDKSRDTLRGENLPPPAQHKVGQAIDWFRQHLAHGATFAGACEAVHVSPAQLRRYFHEVTGHSPRIFFDRIRMEEAMAAMKDPDVSLEAIASRCGYSDATAFSRAFRSTQGIPPSEWRKVL